MTYSSKVFSVIVTFEPNKEHLYALLLSLIAQCSKIIIIDNSTIDTNTVLSCLSSSELSNKSIFLHRFGDNRGIAEALNFGIRYAVRNGAEFLLLSDQDSLPAKDMVVGLLRAEKELSGQGLRVGAVGCTFTDLHTGITFPFQAIVPGKYFYSLVRTSAKRPIVEALSLITSGTLIPTAVWVLVGPMRKDFFIDHVDIEWGHRARAAGFKLYGTVYAAMAHRMGDAQLHVWLFGWHRVNAYSPLRLYYRFRNFIYLLRLGFIPGRWKLRASFFWLQEAYAHLVFSHARMKSLFMITRGCWDGIRGRLGRYPDNQRTRGNQ